MSKHFKIHYSMDQSVVAIAGATEILHERKKMKTIQFPMRKTAAVIC